MGIRNTQADKFNFEKMKKNHIRITEKILAGLDWEAIFEVHKAFKLGVGESNPIIPGVKRKPFSDALTKNDIKNELKIILRHVIENDIPELTCGHWIVNWINEDWDFRIEGQEVEEEENDYAIEVDSRLDVIYSPQRIYMTSKRSFTENKEESDYSKIESMLKKSIESEDYELSSKLKEILFHFQVKETGE
jgi:hypothetical protein